MRWIFVGAGNMASSIIGGLLASGAKPGDVAVIDPNSAACDRACERFAIRSASSLAAILQEFSTSPVALIIAVKPDIVESVCTEFSREFAKLDASAQQIMSPLFISVAAGVRASGMEVWLPDNIAIVRCMPNTPALLGLGASGLYANTATTDKHREQAQTLMGAAGVTLWVETEPMLDAVTAVSGSGPAYFFYLIEHMSAAGKSLGLDAETAEKLAIETAYGAASMARTRELPPARLRENVTSKGGTTAAALQVFDEEGTPAIIHKALQAAHDRSVEFGDQLSPA